MVKQLRWGVCGTGMIAHDFLTALGTLPADQHRACAVAGKERERTQRLASLHQTRMHESYEALASDDNIGYWTLPADQHRACAVAGKERERTQRLASLHQTRMHESYEALASDDNIDIVFVSVLNLQHYEITKLMLEHGKHVLCEKPMGMNHKQTQELVHMARARKLFLLEGMWSRFFPAYDALDKHIAGGGLGDVYHVNVQFGVEVNDIERNLMKDLGGGAVLDLGVYMLQLVQWIFKAAPADVVCTGHKSKAGVDESMSCALKYPDGRTAAIAAHTRVAMGNKAEIVGTQGSVTLEYFWCPTALRLSAANSTEWTLPRGRFNFHFHNSAGLSYQIQECHHCISQGLLESPKLPLDESILLSKLADTMRSQLGVLDQL